MNLTFRIACWREFDLIEKAENESREELRYFHGKFVILTLNNTNTLQLVPKDYAKNTKYYSWTEHLEIRFSLKSNTWKQLHMYQYQNF